MFHVPEKYRWHTHPLRPSRITDGNNGFFIIDHHRIANYDYRVQASDGEGWEHVSITVGKKGVQPTRCPTWGRCAI